MTFAALEGVTYTFGAREALRGYLFTGGGTVGALSTTDTLRYSLCQCVP